MLSNFAVIVAVAAVLGGVQAVDGYTFNYKVTDFFVGMVGKMEREVHCKVESFTRTLQEHSLFNRTVEEYSQLIELARLTASRMCPTAQDVPRLKTIKDTFEASRAECMKETECKDDLAAVAQEIIASVQTIDADAHKAEEACADENCKQKVHHDMHEKIFAGYPAGISKLRLAADKALSNSKCSSAFIQCMVKKNSDNLRQMYTSIARLEVCLGNRVRPPSPPANNFLASLLNRPELNGLLSK